MVLASPSLQLLDTFKFASCVVFGFTLVTHMTPDAWLQTHQAPPPTVGTIVVAGASHAASFTRRPTPAPAEPASVPPATPSPQDGLAKPDPVAWPRGCGAGSIRAVFPNSSAARSEHMQGMMRDIGACGKEVPAVMKDSVASVKGSDGSLRLVYENETILFSRTGSVPRGNIPNAATHSRMIRAWAEAEAVDDNEWAIFFEDDAQLHADIRASHGAPEDVAALLKWSFAAAEMNKANSPPPARPRCCQVLHGAPGLAAARAAPPRRHQRPRQVPANTSQTHTRSERGVPS